jgi:hypothetical protein
MSFKSSFLYFLVKHLESTNIICNTIHIFYPVESSSDHILSKHVDTNLFSTKHCDT